MQRRAVANLAAIESIIAEHGSAVLVVAPSGPIRVTILLLLRSAAGARTREAFPIGRRPFRQDAPSSNPTSSMGTVAVLVAVGSARSRPFEPVEGQVGGCRSAPSMKAWNWSRVSVPVPVAWVAVER